MEPGVIRAGSGAADARSRALLEVIYLVASHTQVDGLLPDLAACLSKVAPFDGLGILLLGPRGDRADVHTIWLEASENGQPGVRLATTGVPPLAEPRSTALWSGHAPLVLRSLDEQNDYPEVVAALRTSGARSACLVPLATAVRPVGLLAFASSRPAAYDEADLVFLQHVASHVSITIDNVLRHQEALACQHRVEVDRDHWRTLLEITNALVSNLDLGSVLDSLTPNLRHMVAHDYTIALIKDDGDGASRLYATQPKLPAALDDTLSAVRIEDTPFAVAISHGRPVEIEPAALSTFPEPLCRHAALANVRRLCFVPLVTPRRVLGGLMLARRTAAAFTASEQERASQAAGQIAIAIENALAFREIETLKDRLALENLYLEDEIRGKQDFEEIIGDSPALRRVLAQARSVAPTDTTVLLLGETGTGKELIARAIHSMSRRQARTLVTVNCAVSPAGLLESEWFGHEKGAFTGALTQKVGRFQLAHEGTLFLDEIADVPLDLQAKLLRVLQEHEIERLGSTRPVHVDFRLIAATNRSLEEMVADREYRADLYYRLNVFPIRIPPLRERRDDIPPLVRYFVQRYAKRLRREIDAVPRETMEALVRWHWPGNVRELQNVIERAVILSGGRTLRVPPSELEPRPGATPGSAMTLEDAEREHILRTLDDTGWVVGGSDGAAARLGLKRTTLVSTMRRLGIVRPRVASERQRAQGR